MNLAEQLIIEDYRKYRDDFIRLGEIVSERLNAIVCRTGVKYLSIEHRVKTQSSLVGKLIRSDGWYHSFSELMDILGARVICFFSDDVDVIGGEVEKEFVIDWNTSSDKRKLIQSDSFGYLSLHYICSLPKDRGYPEELCDWKFEIQIRTILQHAWSDINHDIGYKSEFGVPRQFTRGFARVAGLLELADEEFVRLRDGMKAYSEHVRTSIIDGSAGEIPLNIMSLNEYMRTNRTMQDFIGDISDICGSEIEYTDSVNYLEQLSWFGITAVGRLSEMLLRCRDIALRLARAALSGSELDLLSANTALRFLCRAELLKRNCSREQMAEFFKLSSRSDDRAEKQADMLIANRSLVDGGSI